MCSMMKLKEMNGELIDVSDLFCSDKEIEKYLGVRIHEKNEKVSRTSIGIYAFLLSLTQKSNANSELSIIRQSRPAC